jgi:hypothetical protein
MIWKEKRPKFDVGDRVEVDGSYFDDWFPEQTAAKKNYMRCSGEYGFRINKVERYLNGWAYYLEGRAGAIYVPEEYVKLRELTSNAETSNETEN